MKETYDMSIEALNNEIRQFVKSSAYQFGDRTGFAINLKEGVTLPGNCSPTGYLDKLKLDKMPEKVMVVCSGNGGLAVECFARGAKQVVAVEPRARYKKGLQGVKRLLDSLWRLEEKHDRALVWHPNWPKVGKDQGLKDFDLILWPEGVEEITTPKETFQAVADCLAPGGRLIVELAHGNHQWTDKINSWRPTGHAVNEMAEAIFDSKPTDKDAGRSATTKIYTLTLPGKSKKDAKKEAAAEAAAEAEAKKRAAAEKKAEAKKAAAAKKAAEAKAAEEKKAEEKPAPPPPPPAETPKAETEPKLDVEGARHVHIDLAVDEKAVEAPEETEAEEPKAEKPRPEADEPK